MVSYYKTCIAFLIVVFCSTACNKDIDLSPESNYNANDFYTTEQDFKLAIAGAYGGLRGIHSYQYPLVLESLSDNISTFTNNPYTRMGFSDGETNILSIWSAYWAIINRNNNILATIDQGTFINEEWRGIIKGEALFLRAFSYFQLGWLFGGVPIIEAPLTAEELTTIPRATQEETMAFAAAGFEQAAELLPEEQTGDQAGRATAYSAKGLLARLHVFSKDYDAAHPILEEIIQSERYAIYDIFADCFLDSRDNGSEHVFQVQYTSGLVNQGNQLVYTLVPENIRSELFPNGGRSLWLAVSRDLYNSYDTLDNRRDFTIQKGYTSSSNVTDTSTLLFIKLAHGAVPPDPFDYGVNLSILRYTDVLLMYAEVLNELGYVPDGEAFQLVNRIRERAGLPPWDATSIPSQEAFREALFEERRKEFAGEFLRWFDLVRQGEEKMQTTMDAFLSQLAEGSDTYRFDPKYLLLPIPAAERQTNPTLEQNPGY
ncbi:RagB/SusD family nutrient uptake outer membrane protein [Parapedobacter tibetensis]|uniref:RagB/SusD family nutrient uptake outer membrane protein n=1 Tax=Parapedobacter tibetensis TaxID=2972951 RepID=UPI00214D69E0|nr:RagB/SusD family nutrient uptake outer membrane protein [Parapedobacter tibetensis]